MKNSLSLKNFLALFAALTVFCLSLCSCTPADDEDDETAEDVNYSGAVLNVYNWGVYMDDGKGEDGDGSYIDEETTMNVNAAFEQYYKETYGEEIKVQYTTYENNEAMYAKLSAGGANYDIVVPSDYMINRMIKEGMLEKLEFSNIPNYQNIDDQFKDGSWQYDPTGEYSVTYTWGTVGIVYDANVVTEEVSSFDILWDEKYAGKILMMNNPRDTFAVALAKNGKSLNSANADDWEQAYEDLERQKPLVQAYVTDECFEKMQNGEASLAPAYCGDFLIMEGDTAEGTCALHLCRIKTPTSSAMPFVFPKGPKTSWPPSGILILCAHTLPPLPTPITPDIQAPTSLYSTAMNTITRTMSWYTPPSNCSINTRNFAGFPRIYSRLWTSDGTTLKRWK